MGIQKNETIYIGDNLIDLKVARKRGLSFLAVTTGTTDKTAFTENNLDEKYIFKGFSRILDLF